MSAQLESASVTRPPAETWRMVRALGGVSLLSGFLIVLAFETTQPRILENRRRAIEAAVFRVLPGAVTRETYAIEGDALRRVDIAPPGAALYAGYGADGKLVGVAIEAAGQGYQDVVRVLYGYSLDRQAATGFTVIESKETPGLGDKIGFEPNFLANFDGLDLQLSADGAALQNGVVSVKHGAKKNAWEIDGISGATVSSKAVARIVNDSAQHVLPIVMKQREQIEARQ